MSLLYDLLNEAHVWGLLKRVRAFPIQELLVCELLVHLKGMFESWSKIEWLIFFPGLGVQWHLKLSEIIVEWDRCTCNLHLWSPPKSHICLHGHT